VIQAIADKMPTYGYRRVCAELKRRGQVVNSKKVRRVMREEDLLCSPRRSFVRTTDSDHQLSVYPNLVKDLIPSGTNQLWAADITYIRLPQKFVYLAVILDVFSRRVIGWALGPTLETHLAIEALRMALRRGRVEPGLVHHSDRGVQYASQAYTEFLTSHGIRISMSRKGNPYDNASVESFMKTLKYEEVYRSEYRDMEDTRRQIRRFIEEVYNRRRLHSALGYRPPVEFERLRAISESAEP
jgi:transposase InsO family protein